VGAKRGRPPMAQAIVAANYATSTDLEVAA